jgi:hypothetical protein
VLEEMLDFYCLQWKFQMIQKHKIQLEFVLLSSIELPTILSALLPQMEGWSHQN